MMMMSVRPSVTFRCFIQMNKDTIVRFSASGRTIILISGEVKLVRILGGITPSEGVKVRHPIGKCTLSKCLVINLQMVLLYYLKFVMKRYTYYYYYCQLICN